MKTHHHVIALALTLAALFQGPVHAAGSHLEIMDDHSLAAVRGGFCIFDKCESAPSGVCQPIAPTAQALCATVRCVYFDEVFGNTVSEGCTFFGKTTCANAKNYRQCIQVYFFHLCTDSGTTPCGNEIDPACHPSMEDRACVCSINDTGSPCDWTDCNL